MKLKRVLLSCVAVLFAAGALGGRGSSAQSKRLPTQLPPLPLREKGFPAALAPVVRAEQDFARHSIDHGMKPAFLAYAAPEGVILDRRGLVNAIEAWSQREPAPTGLLTWWPTYADVSRAGDMGWTTGPYEFREKPTAEKPDDTGHFFTVWRRQADGSWKWVLDLGVRHPAPAVTETALTYPPALGKSKGPAAPAPAEAARKSLEEAELVLSDAAASAGFQAALLIHADDGVRLYRQGAYPVVGKTSAVRAVKALSDFVKSKVLKADVARSGDLGYAYGSYELRAKPLDERPAERGHFARVWKRERGGQWRVVFSVMSPAQ